MWREWSSNLIESTSKTAFDPLPNISLRCNSDIERNRTPRLRLAGKFRYSTSRHWTDSFSPGPKRWTGTPPTSLSWRTLRALVLGGSRQFASTRWRHG
jgi:hypothetical protein